MEPERDRRFYAIKRKNPTVSAAVSIVDVAVGKDAASRAVVVYDDGLTVAERTDGWEHYFEPMSVSEVSRWNTAKLGL